MKDGNHEMVFARTHRNSAWQRGVALGAGLALVCGVAMVFAQQPVAAAGGGVQHLLRKGQPVSVKDGGVNYELTVWAEDPPTPLSHTVVDVTDDCVLVRDFAGITETAIPLHSIKSVATIRMKGLGGR